MVWITIDLNDGDKPLGFRLSEKDAARLHAFMDKCNSQARDATRYRWLYNRDLDTIKKGGMFVGIVPDNVVINGKDLDIAIDEAITKLENG
jgi:hypothetical protein